MFVERGVDVKIIRHCKGVYHRGERGAIKWVPDSTTDEAERAIRSVGEYIEHLCTLKGCCK